MKRKRSTEKQIIGVLRESTLYNWTAKYGGTDISDAKRLRSLKDANRKLKKLLAKSMLDQAALKELLTMKWQAFRA